MSYEMGILYNKAQRIAKATKLKPKELEQITGHDREWIRKIISGEIGDPGANRLEDFVDQIKKYNARQRRAKNNAQTS